MPEPIKARMIGLQMSDEKETFWLHPYEFQCEPQSRNRQIVNLRTKWGFPPILGACAMTTKILDNKICTF